MNYLDVFYWWSDASYKTHPDLKGKTGNKIFIRKEYFIIASKRQRLNTTGSTISELVGFHKAYM